MPNKRKRQKQNTAMVQAPLPQLGPERYINRELSWLEFNRRVLDEALAQRHPLLERVKYLAISASILDEIFMKRVSGLRAQVEAGVTQRSADGRTPQEQLALIRPLVEVIMDRQRRCWLNELLPELASKGIRIKDYGALERSQRQAADELFHTQLFPVLTPLAFDPGHPFPHISNLSLNLAVVVRDRRGGQRFAR